MSEEYIQITPFGLLTIKMDDDNARTAIDSLELYCRRHNRALAVDACGTFRFVELQRCDDAPQPDPLADHPELFPMPGNPRYRFLEPDEEVLPGDQYSSDGFAWHDVPGAGYTIDEFCSTHRRPL